MYKTHFLTVIAICVFMCSAFGAVPQLINFQGVLTDSAGTPLDGPFNITFKIYGQAFGGTDLWSEAHLGVAVSSGSFSVKLGSIAPFGGIEPTGSEFWMGITVATDPELIPRTQLVSVPFAFQADEAVLADTASYAFQAGCALELCANSPALAAIKALNKENQELKKRLRKLEELVKQLIK